ncbi:MAG: hypothetical protein K2N26_00180 [Oscillospiraceae bacterium]|nr:hypothetical protein [Oscillospiraceae bacterium]
MKCSTKKISALISSAVIIMSALAVTTSAEENIPTGTGEIIENYSVTPRAALPAGAYYSTTNPTSFIKIDSGTDATCLVSLVIYDSEGNKISGTGYYYYSLKPSVLILLDSCYKIDTNGNRIPQSSFSFYVTYSGGALIVDDTGEKFVI